MACEIKDPTNNPICSDSLKDLKDNAIIMDQYINSEEFEVPDRLGIPRKTWAGVIAGAQIGSKIYENTTEGISNTENGEYFSVISPDNSEFLNLYLNNNGTAVLKKTYPSSEYIVDKTSIFVQIDRNGTLGIRNQLLERYISKALVYGGKKNKFYSIDYFQNDAVLGGVKKDVWRIIEIDKFTGIESPVTTDGQIFPVIDRTLQFQEIEILSFNNPNFKLKMIINPQSVTAGTPIAANAPHRSGYSYVIDPILYIESKSMYESNSGTAYPLKQATKNGITSAMNEYFSAFILDARVVNAHKGSVYSLRYFNNGELTNSGEFGWIIAESKNWSDSADDNLIIQRSNLAPDIDRDGGLQWISIFPPENLDGLRFDLLIDASKIPKKGVSVGSNFSGLDGYSWIIDPVNYHYTNDDDLLGDSFTYNYNKKGNILKVTFNRDNKYKLRVTLGENGFNKLFNIIKTEFALLGSDDYKTLSNSQTDWFPPLNIKSNTAPFTEGAAIIYTGGNHGSDGGAGGENTAFMSSISFKVNGKILTENSNGITDRIEINWVNEVYAFNTIEQKRPVVNQYLSSIITRNNIELWSNVEARESMTVNRDNACQMISTGFTDAFYMKGEDMSQSFPISTPTNSGRSYTAPDCFAVVLSGGLSEGIQASWIDTDYGLGDGSKIASSEPRFRRGSGTNTKFYSAAVANTTVDMNIGESYSWRGGYVWSGNNGFEGIQNALVINSNRKKKLAYSVSSGKLEGVIKNNLINTGDEVNGVLIGSKSELNVSESYPSAFIHDIS